MNANALDMSTPRGVSETMEESAPAGAEVVNLHRDERDVRLLLQMSVTTLLVICLLMLSLAGNVWMYYRRPDRIVVDRRPDGDHVVSVNDQPVNIGAVSVGPDKLSEEDKRRIVNEWAGLRYGINPQTRERAIERLLKMMEPTAAAKYVALLKRTRELEMERSERRQAVWKPQLTTVDTSNPYRVNIVGTQEMDKSVGGAMTRESKQVIFSLMLMVDKESGRAEHNLYTGFLVLDILDLREVVNKDSGRSALPDQSAVK